MKIVSHKAAHGMHVREHGRMKINGLTFTAGESGKPHAYDATEAQVALFCGVEGFSFYHDDGSLAGESHTYRPRVGAVMPADVESHVLDLLASGQLTPAMLNRLSGAVVGAPAQVAPGTVVDANGFPVTSVRGPVAAGLDVTTQAPDVITTQAPDVITTQGADATGLQDDDLNGRVQDDQTPVDFTSLAYVGTLKRADLTAAATSYGVPYKVTDPSTEIAGRIVEAAKAKADREAAALQ